jgi:hypothetical protein
VIQPASSGRAKCRGCGRSIRAAELRFGEALPNPYAEGEALYWFHLACAACMRPKKFLPALAADASVIADRDWLVHAAEVGIAHRRLPRLLRAERAASGRARCRSCRELMEKDQLRLALQIFEDGRMSPIGSIHVGCAEAYLGTADIVGRIEKLCPELDSATLSELEGLLRVQRAPSPESTPEHAAAAQQAGGDGAPSADVSGIPDQGGSAASDEPRPREPSPPGLAKTSAPATRRRARR